MKRSLFALLLLASTPAMAQKLDLGLSAGSGKSYIIEDLDNNVNVNYSAPLSLLSELRYMPTKTNWGIKLRLHHLQSNVTGTNWTDGTKLNGYANSLTTSLMFENEKTKENFSYGVNFGLGITRETVQPQQYYPAYKSTVSYASVTLGGQFAYKLSKSFDVQLQPVLLCQDPFKGISFIAGKRNANFAGEDVTAVINIGLRYHITK